MKLGILLSGGKDSVYSAYLANKEHELACAITIKSKNKESYMFHTPNIDLVHLQAEAMNLPLIIIETEGEKEKELKELHQAIAQAKKEYHIEGIVTGAVASQYQASRVQRICHELDLWCFNPLWQINQVQLLEELLEHKFETIIGGVFAYPFSKEILGKVIDKQLIEELKEAQHKYKVNPAGEGGEIETLVIDCPLFKQKISVLEAKSEYDNYAGTYNIQQAKLIEKKEKQIDKEVTVKTKAKKTKAKPKGSQVLIISTVNKSVALFENEFVRPLVDLCLEANQQYTTINISELESIEGFDKIIISGTGLKDNGFFANKEKFTNIIKSNIPILGICAGAELLLPKDHKLGNILEIGPLVVEELNEDTLSSNLDGEECYFLHQKGLRAIPFSSELDGLLASKEGIAAFKYKNKEIYGVQFHPEVSQKQLILDFIK